MVIDDHYFWPLNKKKQLPTSNVFDTHVELFDSFMYHSNIYLYINEYIIS